METALNKNRIWELDFFRGIALIIMIYCHTVFDLKEFYNYPVSFNSGFNYYIGRVAVILFMLISGISCILSRSNVKRGLKILGIALAITIATHLFNPNYGIKFGILHYFGVSMLIYPLFRKLNKYMLIILGTAIIALGYLISKITVGFDYLFPIGIVSSKFVSSDFYPLVPWLGVFLYGIAIGKIFYVQKMSIFKFSLGNNLVSKVGQKTLPVYVMHQPVIIATLALVNLII